MANKRDIKNIMNRRTKEPPEKMKELLELVNALPYDAPESPVDNLRVAIAVPYEQRRIKAIKGFESYFVQLPTLLQEFLRQSYDSGLRDAYERAQARYTELLNARSFLQNIARENMYIWDKSKSYKEQEMLEHWRRWGIGTLSSQITLINWSLNSEGFLDPQLSFWMQDLRGVEVIRIRQCPMCNRIFWAGRIDKSTCSEKCGQVWRQRLSRDAWKEHGKQYRAEKKTKSSKGNQTKSNKQKGDE